jgi:hypothetical protein
MIDSGERLLQLAILVPVYNDWGPLKQFLSLLNGALAKSSIRPAVLVIDDGSTDVFDPESFTREEYPAFQSLEIIELGRNLGNQRAVSMGLAYIAENVKCDALVLMDADGEDDPNDVPRLIETFQREGGRKLVFARRVKRADNWAFKVFYYVYKLLYRWATGTSISMGNFSIIPARILARLAVISEIGSHYVAGILKARIPHTLIDTERAPRLAGRSKMNFTALVMHGLGGIAVHSDTLGVKALMASVVLMIVTACGIVVVALIRLTTDWAIPGWASTLSSSLTIVLFQGLMTALMFAFITLNGRNVSSVLPKRDYRYFILEVRKVF